MKNARSIFIILYLCTEPSERDLCGMTAAICLIGMRIEREEKED